MQSRPCVARMKSGSHGAAAFPDGIRATLAIGVEA